MAIQSRLVLATAVFYVVLTSRAFAPTAAASPWPDDFGVTPAIEYAAVPPPVDESVRPDLLGEQALDGVGSIAEQEAASETEPAGVDPWADAFAESSRASVVAVAKPKPSYPVTVNPKVQHFL